MNRPDTPHTKTRFSIRSLLVLIAFSAILFVVVRQHQQNQEMQRRIEVLSARAQHLEVALEDAREKLELLRTMVSIEPTLNVSDVSDIAPENQADRDGG